MNAEPCQTAPHTNLVFVWSHITVPEEYIHPVLTYFAGIMQCYLVKAEHIIVKDELCTVLDWKVLGQELRLPQEILIGIDYDNQRLEHNYEEGNYSYMVR